VIRVLLVDDQPMIRTGFRLILESQPDLTVVGECADGRSAVESARTLRPDVVLTDIRISGADGMRGADGTCGADGADGLDGVEATRRIVSAGLPTKVLILTTLDLDEHVVAALRAGASGFLVKDGPAESLVAAVRTVASGDAVISPRVSRRLLGRFAELPEPAPPPSLGALTGREVEVLRAVARGLSNAEIAAELFVSEATVKTHVSHILEKCGLRDRVQAVVLAFDTGLALPAGRT
jgi:DNA-binding NarL/FixJ family response regulator